MRCPRCKQDNPPQARFCMSCGEGLTPGCSHCGTELPVGAAFCFACGRPVISAAPVPAARFASPESYTPKHLADKILTTRSALEGERKQVTVLFADVSGFTALSERLDPEEVHRLMVQAFDLLLAQVHRYEGTVNQFLGDGIMALFGAPIAHEDHAQRAVHAALGIVAALERYQEDLRRRGITFRVRQGLNTGLVVVGSIGSDLRMDYTAVGDTTNVAARVQQAAAPGQILVAEATHRLVADYFHTRPVGELALKGKSEAKPAWEVITTRASRTPLEIRAERGLTPFVGRQRELGLLMDRFEEAKNGRGQVVFIVGEPGIGKSRLLYEFRRTLGKEAAWLEAHCVSFGQSMAFHPLIDLLRRSFGIEEADAETTMVGKIERGVLDLGEDLRPTLPFVRYLLSIDPGDRAVLGMDPQQRRGEIFDALRRLMARAAEARPQVVVYEDLHWIDQATEEYLLFSADGIPASRVLHVLSYRTGYSHPFGERSYHNRLALTALPTEASVRMAEAMLAASNLPEELTALIVRKAEGNPFFVEEVVRSLQEGEAIKPTGDGYVLTKPIHEIVVPDTVEDVLMARVDRLPEGSKRTLQLASVIGRDFTRRLLDRLSETREQTESQLGQLKAVELIYEKAVYPELAYTFKHALTQEVAYGSLLIERRKDLHRRVGLAIEELYGNGVTEQYEVLAYHFGKATAWSKAFEYLVKAAEKAAKAFATREAITLYDQADQAAAQLGDAVPDKTRMEIYRGKAELYTLVSEFDRARAEGERALTVARQLGDQMAAGSALVGMGFASYWGHQFDRALDDVRQAIEVAEPLGANSILAGAYLTAGLVHEVTGQLDAARSELEQAISISRSAGDVINELSALVYAGELKTWEARFDEAVRLYRRGISLARTHNVLMPLLEGLFMCGITLVGRGEYDGALAMLEEGLTLAKKVGNEDFPPRYLNSLGWLHIECGNLDRALELNRQAAEQARKRRDHESIGNAEINLADIFLMKNDVALAGEFLDGVHRQVRDPATSEWMRWRYSIHLFSSLAELQLVRGDLAKAGEFADHCLDLATQTNSRKYLVKAWRLRGEIAVARRQWDEGDAALRQALPIARAIGNPTQLWKTHLAVGQLHTEARRPDAARAAYQDARAVIDRVRTDLRNPDLVMSLDRAPLIRQIYELGAPD